MKNFLLPKSIFFLLCGDLLENNDYPKMLNFKRQFSINSNVLALSYLGFFGGLFFESLTGMRRNVLMEGKRVEFLDGRGLWGSRFVNKSKF